MLATFLSSNIFVSFFLRGILGYLWGLVNTLQIIVLTALFSVGKPQHTNYLMISLMKILNFDTVEVEPVIKHFFTISDTEPFND